MIQGRSGHCRTRCVQNNELELWEIIFFFFPCNVNSSLIIHYVHYVEEKKYYKVKHSKHQGPTFQVCKCKCVTKMTAESEKNAIIIR